VDDPRLLAALIDVDVGHGLRAVHGRGRWSAGIRFAGVQVTARVQAPGVEAAAGVGTNARVDLDARVGSRAAAAIATTSVHTRLVGVAGVEGAAGRERGEHDQSHASTCIKNDAGVLDGDAQWTGLRGPCGM